MSWSRCLWSPDTPSGLQYFTLLRMNFWIRKIFLAGRVTLPVGVSTARCESVITSASSLLLLLRNLFVMPLISRYESSPDYHSDRFTRVEQLLSSPRISASNLNLKSSFWRWSSVLDLRECNGFPGSIWKQWYPDLMTGNVGEVWARSSESYRCAETAQAILQSIYSSK